MFMSEAPKTISPAIPRDVADMAFEVLKAACDRELRVATAESCTGGLLAALLTDIEGCSHAFERGFVCYTDEAKIEMLGVDADLLARLGAVSHDVAEAMAAGALARSRADIALSITGYTDNSGEGGSRPGVLRPGLPWPPGMRRGAPLWRYRPRSSADRVPVDGADAHP
jgi:nicotinamide-nucleotide amidase